MKLKSVIILLKCISFGSLAIFATQLSTGCQQPIENIGSKKHAEESLLNTKEIFFDLQNIDISMEKSEDGKLRIEENIDRNQATYQNRQQGDSIFVVSKGVQSHTTNPGSIKAYIPDGYNIYLDGMSGSVRIFGLSTKIIRIELMSGDIRIKNLATRSGIFKTMSGNIYFNSHITTGTIKLEAMSGDLEAILDHNSDAKIEMKSEKSAAILNGRNLENGKISTIINNGQAHISGNTLSGTVDCQF